MYELEDRYWWFVGRRHIIQSLIKEEAPLAAEPTILDLGCGTGGTLPSLAKHGRTVGADFSLEAIRLCRTRGSFDLVNAEATRLPFKNQRFDLVTVLDVLEHIDDDLGVLVEIERILRPNGRVLIAVPAYPSLWSEHDEALQHKRRYQSKQLRDTVTTAGFRIVKLSFAIAAVLPPVYLLRWLQRLRRHPDSGTPKTAIIELPAFLNNLLVRYLRMEAHLIRRVNLPFGVSIVCVAVKR